MTKDPTPLLLDYFQRTGYLLTGCDHRTDADYLLFFCRRDRVLFRVEARTAQRLDFRCPLCRGPNLCGPEAPRPPHTRKQKSLLAGLVWLLIWLGFLWLLRLSWLTH